MRLWKELVNLLFNLLRAIASTTQIGRATAWALRWDAVGIATVVARQLVQLAVVGQRDITVLTGRHPATLPALYHRGKAAAVLEQDDLFTTLQGLTHPGQQQWGERTVHHLTMLQVGNIYNLYLRQFYSLIAFLQLHQSIFAGHGVMVALQRGRSRTQQHLWCFSFFFHLSTQHDSHTAGMIAGRRVLLLIAGLVFLVDNDQA